MSDGCPEPRQPKWAGQVAAEYLAGAQRVTVVSFPGDVPAEGRRAGLLAVLDGMPADARCVLLVEQP